MKSKGKSKRWPALRTGWSRLLCGAAAALAVCFGSNGSGEAAVSLDGSHCIIFGGQVKRELAVCVAWEGEGQTLSISLVGRAPNHVERIVLRRDGADPFQTLHLQAQPPISLGNVGLLYVDMNFDGYGDLGIMRREHTAVHRPFFYFLYDARLKKFTRAPVLETLDRVTFDAKAKRVTSRWRDQARSYKDSYAWYGKSLRLSEREQWGGAEAGCQMIAYQWAGNRREERARTPC